MPSEEYATPPGNPLAPTPAPVIPDHELLRLIGRGAYGEVWLARNAIGTLRAVKVVHRQSFQRAEYFEREFKGLLKFEPVSRTHEGLVHILQIGRRDEAGYFFYVMELADATNVGQASSLSAGTGNFSDETGRMPVPLYSPRTLRSDLDKGSLPPAECVTLGLKLASALEHLHTNGLVHRDIKPSNIIFVKGEPKLADIGLVTAIDEAQSLVGTAGYIPPEGPGAAQADLYSLGKVLYEIAFGKDRQEFPQLPPDLQSHLDYAALLELNEIILKACETDSRLRYASAAALCEDLELLQRGKSVKQKRTRQQRWAMARKVLAAAAVVGVLAMGATMLWRQSRVTRPLSSNPQAEALYQQAEYEVKSETLDRLQQAYTNLNEAVKLDPGFVDAYFKMFDAYLITSGDKLPPYYDSMRNIGMVATNLQRIAPNSAEFHTANSLIRWLDWDFDAALKEAEAAIKADPQFLRAHGLYGCYLLRTCGDAAGALREFKIAEQIDPTDVVIQEALGELYYAERNFIQAIAQNNKAIQLEPRTILPHLWLARTLEAEKQFDQAIDEYEKYDLLDGGDPEKIKPFYAKQRQNLHEKGPRGWWQAQLDENRKSPTADSYYTARLCVRLGNTEEAFIFLERAHKQHNWDLGSSLLVDDAWDTIRGDPRFQELLKAIGYRQKK